MYKGALSRGARDDCTAVAGAVVHMVLGQGEEVDRVPQRADRQGAHEVGDRP